MLHKDNNHDWLTGTRLLFYTIIGLFCVDLISFIAYCWPQLNTAVIVVTAVSVLLISLYRVEYGLWVLVAELVYGSKGHLFAITVGGATISLRMILFVCVLAAWSIAWARNKKSLPINHPSSRSMLMVMFLIGWGIVRAVMSRNDIHLLYEDVNKWLYWALWPVMITVLSDRQSRQRAGVIIVGAATALSIKTLAILYFFSHGAFLGIIPIFYRWLRDTGVAEITKRSNMSYRIFSQSHIYALLLIWPLVSLFTRTRTPLRHWKKQEWFLFVAGSLFFSSVIIGMSRSFWIAFLVAVLIGAFMRINTDEIIIRQSARWVLSSAVFILSGVILLVATAYVPIPSSRVSTLTLEGFTDRLWDIQNEPALSSRWKLLTPLWHAIEHHTLLGSGFGSTVRYQSSDPRILAQNSTGWYTTYAFEWGYLDLWLKTGVIGLVLYGYVLWQLFRQGWKTIKDHTQYDKEQSINQGLFIALCTLVTVHFFTPYLNHPLGIGFLLFLMAVWGSNEPFHSGERSFVL